MPDKDYAENMSKLVIANLIDNIFKDFNSNSIANDKLSMELDVFITQIENGEIPSHVEFTHFFNRAMEHTKSDPDADEEKYDRLKAIGDFTLSALTLPKINTAFLIVLLRFFQKVLLGSQRRHFHFRDKKWHDYATAILSNVNFIAPSVLLPAMDNAEKQAQQLNNNEKRRFRKK